MSSGHIGVITFDLYPFEPRVRRLTEAALSAGYEVDVICLLGPGEKHYEVYNGAHLYRMRVNRDFGGSLPVMLRNWCQFLFLASFMVARLHLKYAYDVIHVHNIPDFLVFTGLFPKLLGAKIILDVQDVTPELMTVRMKGHLRGIVRCLAVWQERMATTFANHVVTVGWPFEELLLQRRVPRNKLTIILNSTDPVLFPASRRCLSLLKTDTDSSRPFIIMYHGTLAERNGLDTAIQALALARRVIPALRLDIQGDGNHLPILKKLAIDLGVAEHVVFSGSCPSENVVDFVVHGDVGIIPYRCDGFMDLVLPTKAYEYAWMHRPMIVSDTPAVRSMFRPESVGFCKPSCPESFARAIIDLYQHPEKRTRMISDAAEDYEPFRWELMAKRYSHLLASLARKKAPDEYSVSLRDS